MRIAFIVNQFPKLSESFILNQIVGLMDRGHEVDIFALSPSDEVQVHAAVEKYGLLKHTYLLGNASAVRGGLPGRYFMGAGLAIMDFWKNPEAVVRSLNVFEYGRTAASLSLFYQMRSFLGRGPYDIVHGHFGPLGHLAMDLKKIGAVRGKIVTTFRGYDVSACLNYYGNRMYDELFRKGDLFLCVSAEIRQRLIQLGCDPGKMQVHRSGVQLEKFEFQPRQACVDGRARLLTIARLEEKKGVEYGVHAVARLIQEYPALEYRIAGDGHLRRQIQTLIEELGISRHVHLLGWQPESEVLRLLQESDILLAPSITSSNGDSEGIPGSVIQALACGVPVISTWHAGIPEVVQDGESGFLVLERDSQALAEKVKFLLDRHEIGLQLSRRGREYVEKHYALELLNDRLVETYGALLEGEPAAATFLQAV